MEGHDGAQSAQGDDCDCLSCRMQTVIINEVANAAEGGKMSIDARLALAALLPTVAMLMAAVPYRDTEEWWLEVLSQRSSAMMPDEDETIFDYKGRA